MNSFDLIDPALLDAPSPEIAQSPDGHPGYTTKFEAEDTTDAVRDACGSASRSFPKALWIEPKDWETKARENDKFKTWPMNYSSRYTNQVPTHECTCHSLVQNFECAWNRAAGLSYADGPRKNFRYAKTRAVFMSPMSVYNRANPNIRGGANVRQVLEIAVKYGILPDKIQPNEYGFKHQLQGTQGGGNSNQSSGEWVSVRNMPAGWEETAKHFRPLEVIFPESYEQAVCLVLHGYMVSVGRSGHAIPWAQYLPGQGMAYPDSYNVTRYDSMATVRRAWGGAFAIATVTAPDDWSKPAG